MKEASKTEVFTYQALLNSPMVNKFLGSRNTWLAVLILVVSIGLMTQTNQFLTKTNLSTVTIGMTYDLLMASGMTLVLILGGIDLSVGSILGLTGVVTTLLMKDYGYPIPIAILLGLGVACLCGAINGFGVARLKLAPFIVTLGMMSVARGVATVLTQGYFVSPLPSGYLNIGQGAIAGIPYPILFVIPTLLIFDYLLRNWKPLNQMFYIGSNPPAARLSGIRVAWLTFFGYVISGLMAGIAAIFMTSRLAMGFFQFGLGSELTAIAASVIGGASLTGGTGNIMGTFLGVFLLALIRNGFVLLQGDPNWQNVVSGAILVTALMVDAYRRRKESRE